MNGYVTMVLALGLIVLVSVLLNLWLVMRVGQLDEELADLAYGLAELESRMGATLVKQAAEASQSSGAVQRGAEWQASRAEQDEPFTFVSGPIPEKEWKGELERRGWHKDVARSLVGEREEQAEPFTFRSATYVPDYTVPIVAEMKKTQCICLDDSYPGGARKTDVDCPLHGEYGYGGYLREMD